MKYFSLAIVAAFLCAAVVSAAPSSPNPTFQDLAYDPIAEITKNIREYWVDLKCVRDVITKVIGDSVVKEKWERVRTEFNVLVTVEWKKCTRMEGRLESYKCKLEVVRKGLEYISEFVETVKAEDKELFKRIWTESKDKCFEERTSFLEDRETRDESIADQFQCLVDVLGEVSKANGMEDMWSETQPELQRRLDSWKGCANAGNKLQVIICNIREGIATYKMLFEYIQMMATRNPQAIQDVMRGVQEKCSGQKAPDMCAFLEEGGKEGGEGSGGEHADRLKCIIEAVDEAIKESDFQGIWEQAKTDLTAVVERMKACNTEQNRTEKIRCMRKELSRAREIVYVFFRDWRQNNRDTFRRMRNYVKERCFL